MRGVAMLPKLHGFIVQERKNVFYLFIYKTKQTEVQDVKAPLSGHYQTPFSSPTPSQGQMCLCS